MLQQIDHIGVAVKNLDDTIKLYRDIIGLELLETEEVESQKVKVAKFNINGVHIEFLEPTADDSPIAKFMNKHGEGLHHIAYRTDDIYKELEHLKSKGVKLINEEPFDGASGVKVAFIHPKSSIVLTELVGKGE